VFVIKIWQGILELKCATDRRAERHDVLIKRSFISSSRIIIAGIKIPILPNQEAYTYDN
jgi:hypothetical protein